MKKIHFVVILGIFCDSCYTHSLVSNIVSEYLTTDALAETVQLALGYDSLNCLPFITSNLETLPAKLLSSIQNHSLVQVTNGDLQREVWGNALIPRPRAIVIAFSSKIPRAELTRLLSNLRVTNLWDTNAVFIMLNTHRCYSKIQNGYVQRTLTRFAVYRALGIGVMCEDGVRTFIYTSAQRPSKSPGLVPVGSDINTIKPANIAGHALGVAVYTYTKNEQGLCRKGMLDKLIGSDILTSLELTSALHLKPLCYSRHRYVAGGYLPNGSYTGLLAGLATGKVDILFHSTALDLTSKQWIKDFTAFYPHSLQNYCAYVRKSDPLQFLEGTAKQFSLEVWFLLGSLLLVLAILRNGFGERSFMSAVVTTAGTFISGTFRPKRPRVLLFLSLGTSIFGLIMVNVYQSFFTSILSAPKFEKDLSTLEEVDESVTWIHTYSNMASRIKDSIHGDNDLLERLVFKMIPANKPDEWLKLLPDLKSHGRRALFLFDHHAGFFIKQPSVVRHGRSLLHRVPECLLSAFPVGYVARRNSPYAARLDGLHQRLLEAGVLGKQKSMTEPLLRTSYGHVKLPDRPPVLEPYALQLESLVSAFKLLSWGLLLSFFMFVWEMVKCRCIRWRDIVKRFKQCKKRHVSKKRNMIVKMQENIFM